MIGYDIGICIISHTESLVKCILLLVLLSTLLKIISFFLNNARFYWTKVVRYFSFAWYKIMIIIQEIVLILRRKGNVVRSYMYESSANVSNNLDCELLIDPLHLRGNFVHLHYRRCKMTHVGLLSVRALPCNSHNSLRCFFLQLHTLLSNWIDWLSAMVSLYVFKLLMCVNYFHVRAQ